MARSKTYEMLLKIAGDNSSLKKACAAASENLSTLGEAAKKAGQVAATALTGLGTAAAGIATAATSAYTEHEKAANSLAAATGARGEELASLQSAMESVYQNNFGESIEDAANAVALVNRNIKDIPAQEIAGATEAAIALRDAFEYDVSESTRAAAAIRKNFGGSAEEAFGLIAAGAQNGLDYSGELIDTINEYSSQFSKLGFTADGMFQLLQSGADSTAWNLDKVGDAVKEFSIRAIDGSDSTVAAFEALGYNAGAMMGTFAAGGDGANQAFFDVLNTLMDMEDQVARDALGVSLFGTMWEDLGAEAMEAMANASAGAYDTMDALEQINSVKYNDLGTAMEGVKRQAEAALVRVGEQLVPYAKEGLEYLANNVLPVVSSKLEEITPIVIEAGKALWENRDIILAVGGAVTAAVGAFKGLQVASAAVGAVKNLSTIFNAASQSGSLLSRVMSIGNVKLALIAGGAAALAAGFIYLWNHSEKFRAAVTSLWVKLQPLGASLMDLASLLAGVLGPAFQVTGLALINGLESAIQIAAPIIENVIGIFTGLLNFITGVFTGNWELAWQGVCDIFGNLFGGLANIAKVPINAVIGAVNSVIGAINSCGFTIPDWVPVVGGKSFSINLPEIPMLATGGIVTAPTILESGEGREPEAILPLSKLAAMLQGASNTPEEAPLAQLAKMMDDWTRNNKPGPHGPGQGGDGWDIPDLPRPGTNTAPPPAGGQNPSAAGSEVITFAPVFNFYGPTTREEAVEAGRLSFAEFKRLYDQLKAEERRKQLHYALGG